jgi:hypothetical protein
VHLEPLQTGVVLLNMVTTSSLVLDMRKEEELKKGELRKLLEEEIRKEKNKERVATGPTSRKESQNVKGWTNQFDEKKTEK